MHPGRRLVRPLAFALVVLIAAAATASADFPDITAQERAMTGVPGYPNAPAVVLSKKAKFSVLDPWTGRYRPTFAVTVRRKILTAEGSQRYGEVILHHSRRLRLQNLEARTVLPDGRVVPLPKGATFERRTSRTDKTYTTSVAFPAVTVGAILDYRYEIQLGGGFFIEPWYFQEEVPTVYSEIDYELPRQVVVSSWAEDPMHTGIQQTSTPTLAGGRVVAWGKDLPPIPSEPHSFPYADLASRFMLLPVALHTSAGHDKDMFKDWPSTCALYAKSYDRARRWTRTAERRGKEIAKAVPGCGRRDKAVALYRFVRDEIATAEGWGVALPEDSTGDDVLAARRGTAAEKALLLQTLLAAAGIESRAVWASDRKDGLVNMQFATPWWFDRVLVAVDLDGRRVFLDPADRSLGFGRLDPGVEGMPAVLYDPKNPEVIAIPLTPFEQNGRLAKLDLEVAADGRTSGKGTLRLTGHHAGERIRWQEDAEKAAKAWKEWLVKAFRGYEISAVHVDEQVEEERVDVSWAMAERAEEVLGDESSLAPSRPLGPVQQRFVQPAAERRAGVLFAYADRDEVELTLRWPAGWTVEPPAETRYQNAAGALLTEVRVDAAGRSLTYHRRFDLVQRELPKAAYPAAQALYAVVERNDAKKLSLVRK